MSERVDSAVQAVCDQLVGMGRGNGVNLVPYFDKSAARLRVLGSFLEIALIRHKGQIDASDLGVRALETLSVLVKHRLPDEHDFFTRNAAILRMVADGIAERMAKPKDGFAPSDSTISVPTPPVLNQPSTAAERTAANVRAISLLARAVDDGATLTDPERNELRRYTGFGGLSIAKIEKQLPPSWVPETRGLIHEYYTPPVVAQAIALALRGRLDDLRRADGTVWALEPSAGIGRMIDAFPDTDKLRWFAAESSKVSGNLLKRMRPEVQVFVGPLEDWVQAHTRLRGELGLVVSNPPYGERGAMRARDPDRAYRERRADWYQIRRTMDFLRPGGIGVWLVPAGLLTGKDPARVSFRQRLLLRHHVMAAFRLPSENEAKQSLFPGALVVVDLIFLRSRGGELAQLATEDEAIVEGQYFVQFPSHVLGTEIGQTSDVDASAKKPRWGYQVRGTFTGLPAFVERALCAACVIRKHAPAADVPVGELPDEVQSAVQLAQRTSEYLTDIAQGNESNLKRAAALHADLKSALLAWHQQDDRSRLSVVAFVAQVPELQPLLSAVTNGQLMEVIEKPPVYVHRLMGEANAIVAQAEYLYGQKRVLTEADLGVLHHSLGGTLSVSQRKDALLAAGYCVDILEDEGPVLVPARHYYSGAMWARYDRAKAAATAGDSQARQQAQQLLQTIAPATFADMQELDPRLGWLPDSTRTGWCRHVLGSGYSNVSIQRSGSFWTLEGVAYADIAFQPKVLQVVLGYLNHDLTYFRPKIQEDETLEDVRVAMAEQFRQNFAAWLESDADEQETVVQAFNRLYRGFKATVYEETDLAIARWNQKYPLYGFQCAGVRRLNANHGGGLFFDVGLGKTRTILATLALARQQGWARRPVIAVPGSVIWNWVAELGRVLPDYRYALIGAKKKLVQRGPRKGVIESETDTPEERADKWQRFKAGLIDVVLVTYSSLSRSRMRKESLLPLVRKSGAIQRHLGFQGRSLYLRIERLRNKRGLTDEQRQELEELLERYGKEKGSERREAIQHEQEEGFLADLLELPAGQDFDPGIYWEDLGIDWLAYDESHVGKNLWTVGAREGGDPKFLGAPQEGSTLAWQMYFRAYLVRQNSGGAGVHLADATPAKNSPLEFLSVLSFIDDDVWQRLGISDPEQYVTQFLRIEQKLIQTSSLKIAHAPCVVGFKNLDQLREILSRYAEFRTAAQVGLKIPEPIVQQIEVPMDERQEAKYKNYLKRYEAAINNLRVDPLNRLVALGLLARMALVAVHSALDDGPTGERSLEARDAREADDQPAIGWTYGNASQAKHYSSPKLEAIAKLTAARSNCGTIIFLENNAPHYWLKQVLIAHGVPSDRIAVLNGETAKSTLERQRIAEGFTSVEAPLYDVVIANRIAYEGQNLQTRTCMIIHGDLPMEPATLQQRNGRGQRQGNRYDIIHIYYVLSARSMDMARFQLIAGKREWMAELVESAAAESNNPAAQTDMTPEEWLIYFSRDPERTQRLLAAEKELQRQEAAQRRGQWHGRRCARCQSGNGRCLMRTSTSGRG